VPRREAASFLAISDHHFTSTSKKAEVAPAQEDRAKDEIWYF